MTSSNTFLIPDYNKLCAAVHENSCNQEQLGFPIFLMFVLLRHCRQISWKPMHLAVQPG